MTDNHLSVRHILESKLREAAPTRGMRDSIHIHQVADAVDMTQQAAEREMAVHKLDRDTALRLLKWAFLADAFAKIELPELRRQIEASLAEVLKDAALKELL